MTHKGWCVVKPQANNLQKYRLWMVSKNILLEGSPLIQMFGLH